MGKAFVCDFTGKTCAGVSAKKVEHVGEKFKVELSVYRREGSTFVEADLGPEAVEQFRKAIQQVFPAATAPNPAPEQARSRAGEK